MTRRCLRRAWNEERPTPDSSGTPKLLPSILTAPYRPLAQLNLSQPDPGDLLHQPVESRLMTAFGPLDAVFPAMAV